MRKKYPAFFSKEISLITVLLTLTLSLGLFPLDGRTSISNKQERALTELIASKRRYARRSTLYATFGKEFKHYTCLIAIESRLRLYAIGVGIRLRKNLEKFLVIKKQISLLNWSIPFRNNPLCIED